MKTNELTVIEKIHNEFDTAVDKLLSYSEEIKLNAESIAFDNFKNEEITSKLSELGFNNAKEVKDYSKIKSKNEQSFSEKTKLNSKSKRIIEFIEDFKQIAPLNKVILYSQVIQICEKYNLILGPANLFKGEIPLKNQHDIINFPLQSINNHNLYKEYKLSETIYQGPLCSQNRTTKFYMCAPKNEFNLKNTTFIGNEIYEDKNSKIKFKLEMPKPKPKDPIVLYPIFSRYLDQVAFIIVTAWRKEASDPLIVNEINN